MRPLLHLCALLWAGLTWTALQPFASASSRAVSVHSGAALALASNGPTDLRLPPADSFHPDRQPGADGALPPMPTPTYGGTLTIHTENLPRHLNLALSSSAYARRILGDTHAWLQRYDGRTLQLVPEIADSVGVEDLLTTESGEFIGHVEESGDDWILRTQDGEKRIAKSDSTSLARGTVITFHLGEGWTWHDGHPFDVDDVLFSWRLYQNPDVHCDDRRWQHQKIRSAEKLDARTVRFIYSEQYFHAIVTVSDLFLLPRHLYDPTDPDHARYAPAFHADRLAQDATWKPGPKDVADCINDNPHNRKFVGLGPYRIAKWDDELLEMERAPTWTDDAHAGHVDRIRWRRITSFEAAFRALQAGEIDFDDAVTTEDFLGSIAASESFRAKYYTGVHRSQAYWYIGWNTLSPKLSDPRVRRALAHLADLESYRQGYYRGILARTMTGPFLPDSPACDPTQKPIAHDPARAEALLLEAGWIDRDGDGIRDRDGVSLEIELLVQAQNAPALGFAAAYQEALARAGVRLKIQTLEFSALSERKKKRQFEAVQLGWAMAPEADPEQTWHSKWAPPDKEGGNFVGLSDPTVDALIEAGQRELDFDARQKIWHQLQARLMELQPYLFCYAPLRKFAMLRSVRGFQELAVDPNWNAREFYFAPGTPGTRPALR